MRYCSETYLPNVNVLVTKLTGFFQLSAGVREYVWEQKNGIQNETFIIEMNQKAQTIKTNSCTAPQQHPTESLNNSANTVN